MAKGWNGIAACKARQRGEARRHGAGGHGFERRDRHDPEARDVPRRTGFEHQRGRRPRALEPQGESARARAGSLHRLGAEQPTVLGLELGEQTGEPGFGHVGEKARVEHLGSRAQALHRGHRVGRAHRDHRVLARRRLRGRLRSMRQQQGGGERGAHHSHHPCVPLPARIRA
jgi:hypothetical protein